MEKTAVEYLIEQLEFALPDIEWSNYRNEIDRAKEMEKQQIIKTRQDIYVTGDLSNEQYYNKTFKQD
jgi:hypothetical protein